MSQPLPPLEWDPEAIQLKGFSRGVAEIQWLLVALVLLYLVLADKDPAQSNFPALSATGIYFLFSVGASLFSQYRVGKRWVVAVHTWVMIGFITWLLYVIDGIDGPLVSLYLLAVITSALALGRLATMLEVGAVAACYLLLLYHLRGAVAFTDHGLAVATAHVVMFVLMGYLTTVLADAIHFANDRLRVLAHTDQLTGLYNRTVLRTITAHLFAGAIREGRPFCVLVADMDNLKTINDRYGHDAGDEAIAACARALKSTLRDSDIVARHGGDEFVAFLPNTRSQEAMTLARRLLEIAGTTQVKGGHLRLSIGIASFPDNGETVDELISKADTAMYQAKRAGGSSAAVFNSASSRS